MAWQSYRLTGAAPDLPPDALPAEVWTQVYNVHFRDGVAERYIGNFDAAVTGTAKTRYEFMASLRASSSQESLIYAGNDIAGPRARIAQYLPGTGHADVTPGGWAATAATSLNAWTGGPLALGLLVNDITHQPVWLSPAAAATVLTGGAYRFGALRPYKYIAVGISDVLTPALQTVRWSASTTAGTAPNTWTPAATNDAGSFDLTDQSDGYPVDGGQLGEDFILYADNSMHLMTYVGGSQVMIRRRLSAQTGVLSRNCYADVGFGHVVLTPEDVVLVTARGVEKSLVNGRNRRRIFSGLFNSSDQRHLNSQVWFDKRMGRVWVVTHQALSATWLSRAYVWEIATDTWGEVEFYSDGTENFACATFGAFEAATGAQPKLVIGGKGAGVTLGQAQVLVAETNTAASTSGNTSELLKSDLDLGDASRVKRVKGIRLRASSATSGVTVQVSVAGKYAADETYTYPTNQTWTLNSTQYLPIDTSGRWFSVRIQSAAAGTKAWRCWGFDLDVVENGAW